MFGADPKIANKDMEDILQFEIQLALVCQEIRLDSDSYSSKSLFSGSNS